MTNKRPRAPYRAAPAFIESNVNFSGDECLLWPYAMCPNGYGKINASGKSQYAHREMAILAHGPPPADRGEVAHSCGVRACVNPRHLRWATRAENFSDMVGHGTCQRGEKVWKARFTEAQVLAIFNDPRETRFIALEYGCGKPTISQIRHGKTWAWLTSARKAA